jgi:hypothetical protein
MAMRDQRPVNRTPNQASTADVGGYWRFESEHVSIPIDSRGNEVRVNIVEDSSGTRRLHIREWYETRNGEKRPTRYGGAWPIEMGDDIKKAIETVLNMEV